MIAIQPDRQNGDDGLRKAISQFEALRNAYRGYLPWGSDNTDVKTRLMQIEDMDKAFFAAIGEITPPASHDGAEGAGAHPECPYCGSTSDAHTLHCKIPAWKLFAPPKPAPDAVCASIIEIDGCFEAALFEGWIDAIENGDIERIRDLWYRRLSCAALEARNAISSAPVPSPDGAGEPGAWSYETLLTADNSGENFWDRRLCFYKIHEKEDVRNIKPLYYATPPVRGDREAIARLIYNAGQPSTSGAMWKEAYRIADVILSL